MREDRLITFPGFLDAFARQHRNRKDRPFCFIIGAGASQQSGIPGGAEMAKEWLEFLHNRDNIEGVPLGKWATAERLKIPGFDIENLARFYPDLYSRCFGEREEDGYAYLEKKMEGKDPSFGYSVLAYILSETDHKILITTNFDNLVADSLSIHSNTFPVIVGHDSLADYARVALRRPLIAKVHGSLGFSPKSDPRDLQSLTDQWQKALSRIFERYTPIVIGYDGNDGSLMGSMEKLPAGVPDTIFWCFRDQQNQPAVKVKQVPERVRKFVTDKKGRFVPIPGFDELMLLLHRQLAQHGNVPDLYDNMKRRSDDRVKRFDEQHKALKERLDQPIHDTETKAKEASLVSAHESPNPLVEGDLWKLLREAASDLIARRRAKPWWLWITEAASQPDLNAREAIYKEAIIALPKSAPLLASYAVFSVNEKKDNDQAEALFKRAIEAEPNLAINLGAYASFLSNIREDYEGAEALFRKAIESDPKSAFHLAAYAHFLTSRRNDFEQAELYHRRSIEVGPTDANALGSYAIFLAGHRKDYDQAELFYKRSIEADPKNPTLLGNYASFLASKRHDYTEADLLYRRSIEIDPKNATILGNYANLLTEHFKNHNQAELLYKRSIDVDPKGATTLGNYAVFVSFQRKDQDQAESLYKRSVEAEPKNATLLGNYAVFLAFKRKNSQLAESFYTRSIEADPRDATLLANYASFLATHRKDYGQAESFFKRSLAVDPKNANSLGNYSGMLFSIGQNDDAKRCLEEAEALSPTRQDLQVELAFYRAAHVREDWPSILKRLKALVSGGARSPDWNLEANVEVAAKNDHPNIQLLKLLAAVITEDADPIPLGGFSEWKEA